MFLKCYAENITNISPKNKFKYYKRFIKKKAKKQKSKSYITLFMIFFILIFFCLFPFIFIYRQIYEKNDLTLVTAYYRIKSKHSPEEYFKWINNIVLLN